jgi:hypothetical protein
MPPQSQVFLQKVNTFQSSRKLSDFYENPKVHFHVNRSRAVEMSLAWNGVTPKKKNQQNLLY